MQVLQEQIYTRKTQEKQKRSSGRVKFASAL